MRTPRLRLTRSIVVALCMLLDRSPVRPPSPQDAA